MKLGTGLSNTLPSNSVSYWRDLLLASRIWAGAIICAGENILYYSYVHIWCHIPKQLTRTMISRALHYPTTQRLDDNNNGQCSRLQGTTVSEWSIIASLLQLQVGTGLSMCPHNPVITGLISCVLSRHTPGLILSLVTTYSASLVLHLCAMRCNKCVVWITLFFMGDIL